MTKCEDCIYWNRGVPSERGRGRHITIGHSLCKEPGLKGEYVYARWDDEFCNWGVSFLSVSLCSSCEHLLEALHPRPFCHVKQRFLTKGYKRCRQHKPYLDTAPQIGG